MSSNQTPDIVAQGLADLKASVDAVLAGAGDAATIVADLSALESLVDTKIDRSVLYTTIPASVNIQPPTINEPLLRHSNGNNGFVTAGGDTFAGATRVLVERNTTYTVSGSAVYGSSPQGGYYVEPVAASGQTAIENIVFTNLSGNIFTFTTPDVDGPIYTYITVDAQNSGSEINGQIQLEVGTVSAPVYVEYSEEYEEVNLEVFEDFINQVEADLTAMEVSIEDKLDRSEIYTVIPASINLQPPTADDWGLRHSASTHAVTASGATFVGGKRVLLKRDTDYTIHGSAIWSSTPQAGFYVEEDAATPQTAISTSSVTFTTVNSTTFTFRSPDVEGPIYFYLTLDRVSGQDEINGDIHLEEGINNSPVHVEYRAEETIVNADVFGAVIADTNVEDYVDVFGNPLPLGVTLFPFTTGYLPLTASTNIKAAILWSQSNGAGAGYDGTLLDDTPYSEYAIMSKAGLKIGFTNVGDLTPDMILARETAAVHDNTSVRGVTGLMQIAKGWVDRGNSERMYLNSVAWGGQSITSFVKTHAANHYGLVFEPVVDALVAFAAKQGKKAEVLYMPARQGEASSSIHWTRTSYETAIIDLFDDYNDTIKSKTGQTTDIKVITYQTSHNSLEGETGVEHRGSALGQLDVARNHDRFYLSIPMYQLPHAADGIHATKEGMQTLGKAENHIIGLIESGRTGPNHIAFKPTATISGATVTLEFEDWHTAPLQFDTTTLDATTNQGFYVEDSAGTPSIVSVTIRETGGIEYIDILCDRVLIAGGGWVTYAMHERATNAHGGSTLASGNLRDSTEEVDRFAPLQDATF